MIILPNVPITTSIIISGVGTKIQVTSPAIAVDIKTIGIWIEPTWMMVPGA